MKDALLAWFQTATQTRPYLDLNAKQIDQPNVPRDRAAAEKDMEAYIRRQMEPTLLPKK